MKIKKRNKREIANEYIHTHKHKAITPVSLQFQRILVDEKITMLHLHIYYYILWLV